MHLTDFQFDLLIFGLAVVFVFPFYLMVYCLCVTAKMSSEYNSKQEMSSDEEEQNRENKQCEQQDFQERFTRSRRAANYKPVHSDH